MIKKIRKFLLNYIPIFIKSPILYKWSFLYNLFEIKPSSVVIMLTNRCNLKCVMCKQWQEQSGEELSTQDWKTIIDDLRKKGIKNIHFTGGEPLLRKDIGELIRCSTEKGFRVGMTSNGTLITEENLRSFLNAGLRSIAVSIDALNGKYEKLRGVDNSFERLKEAVFLVSNAKKKHKISAYINFTLMKDTIEDFKKVKNFSDKFGLPVAINLLDKNSCIFNLKENKEDFWIKEKEDSDRLESLIEHLKKEKITKPSSLILNFPALKFIREYFKNPLQKNVPCISSQDRIFIDPYGNILGGCLSMGSFGNVKDLPIEILIKEKTYRQAKRDMFYKKCGGCSCGYLFNIQHFAPLAVNDFFTRLKYFINKNA